MTNDVMMPGDMFLPFPWADGEGRVRTLAALNGFKTADRPVPIALGIVLSRASDAEMTKLYEDVRDYVGDGGAPERLKVASDALTIIGFFHQMNCRARAGDPVCLGALIYTAQRKIRAALLLHAVKS